MCVCVRVRVCVCLFGLTLRCGVLHPNPQQPTPKHPQLQQGAAAASSQQQQQQQQQLWKDAEACLWGLRSIAQHIPEDEAAVMPQIMQVGRWAMILF